MNYKRIIGIIIVVVGLGLIYLSYYITGQVASELSSVKRKTEMLENNPLTEAGGDTAKTATGIASRSINEAAEEKAAPYNQNADLAFKTGIALTGIGILIVIFGRSRSKK